ncbi:MAG: DinB family protein [Planctomycetia bacterium]|nr:DinB family protein [Planctomycetia bacterium]
MTADLTQPVQAALIEELEQLRDALLQAIAPLSDAQLWRKPIEPGNSIGHLLLHLTGNLNHFVGAQLGQTGYVRDREREFTDAQPPPRAAVLAQLNDAVATFRRVVSGLSAEELLKTHPEKKFGSTLKTLIHLVAHFALHRGQVSYLCRLVTAPGA